MTTLNIILSSTNQLAANAITMLTVGLMLGSAKKLTGQLKTITGAGIGVNQRSETTVDIDSKLAEKVSNKILKACNNITYGECFVALFSAIETIVNESDNDEVRSVIVTMCMEMETKLRMKMENVLKAESVETMQ